MHTSNILVNVSACRERERERLKRKHRAGWKVSPFRRREVPPRVTCYEEVLLTFKFYNARMTRRLQIFVFSHSWNIRRTRSVFVRHKTARLFLSKMGLRRKFTVGLSRIYVCTPHVHLENFMLGDIFLVPILSLDIREISSRIIPYNV